MTGRVFLVQAMFSVLALGYLRIGDPVCAPNRIFRTIEDGMVMYSTADTTSPFIASCWTQLLAVHATYQIDDPPSRLYSIVISAPVVSAPPSSLCDRISLRSITLVYAAPLFPSSSIPSTCTSLTFLVLDPPSSITTFTLAPQSIAAPCLVDISIGSYWSSRSLVVSSDAIATTNSDEATIALYAETVTVEEAGIQNGGKTMHITANSITMSPRAVSDTSHLVKVHVHKYRSQLRMIVAALSFVWVPEHAMVETNNIESALQVMEAGAYRRTQLTVLITSMLISHLRHRDTALLTLASVASGDLVIKTYQAVPELHLLDVLQPIPIRFLHRIIGAHAHQWSQ